jgi:hypothetical protein
LKKLREGKLDPTAQAHAIANAEGADAQAMTRGDFAALLPPSAVPAGQAAEILTRGEAMTLAC